MSAVKTQAESVKAIHLELIRQPAFVAPKSVLPKQTEKTRARRLFSIEASQTLSENLRSSIDGKTYRSEQSL
jgi:hypothetical protein